MRYVDVGLVALVIALVAATRIGSASWRRMVHRIVVDMRTAARATPLLSNRYFAEDIARLPLPVKRYFAFALSQGQPLIVAARATSRGAFRLRLHGAWHSFTAIQDFSALPHAFIWDATIKLAPMLMVDVADRYIKGEGAIDARAVGVIPVVDAQGTPELATGELLRYLAELAMMPTALLPRNGVQWSPVDATSARVTLTDHGTTVSARFFFGTRGEIVRVEADRFRDVDGMPVLTPWIGDFREYRSVQGMMVPMYSQAAWLVDGEVRPYFRGHALGIAFELAS